MIEGWAQRAIQQQEAKRLSYDSHRVYQGVGWASWALLVLVVILCSVYLHGQSRESYRLAVGKVLATDQEADECYFSIGGSAEAFAIVTHPSNEACRRLRELRSRTGMLFFIPDE